MISSVRLDGSTACMAIDGVTDTEVFRAYVREVLIPTPPALLPAGPVPERWNVKLVFIETPHGPAINWTSLFALFFGVKVEKPFDRTLDLLKIRIRQASNHTLEFMMLYGL